MKCKTAVRAGIALTLCSAMLASGAAALAEGATVVTRVLENSAPVAKNLELTTFRDIPVTGTFEAADPDGDAVAFSIAAPPKYGTAEMTGDNTFTYTPAGKKSKDVFTYVAVDPSGSVSEEATVTVTINKQKTSVSYSDMDGKSTHYAALRLAEEGVFTGQQLGSEYFFEPEASVARGEFLAMCLSVCGVAGVEGVGTTGFYDDGEIPAWVKPYVAAALLEGRISGYKDESGQTVFSADAPITFAEATVMLNNMLDVSDVAGAAAAADTAACPVWAYQASVNLASCGVLTSAYDYSKELTRGEAAEMLCAAMDVIASREDGGLFSWLE